MPTTDVALRWRAAAHALEGIVATATSSSSAA
jgi:hypothetical protein